MTSLLNSLSLLGKVSQASLGRSSSILSLQDNAFGPLRTKMEAGQNAVLLANTDSTGYSDYGPYYKFGVALGNLYDYTVVMYRWAEWVTSAATGPKEYSAPVTLRTGTRGTLTIYLAALPGQVIGCMFEGSRKPLAIDAIPTPDVVITHHGHNMQSFETPGNDLANGRGLFWSVIGMISWQWQGVPQVITSQNPWRDDTNYTKVYNALRGVVDIFPSITFIDTYQLFINANKATGLYRDNIHPSDTQANSTGAQLQADALLAKFLEAKSSAFSTVSWMELPIGTQLFTNGDLSNWTGALPVNFQAVAGGAATKDTTPANIFPGTGASYSAAVVPAASNGHFSSISNAFDTTERASMVGKTITGIMLVKANPLQRTPSTSFLTRANSALRTYAGGALLWDQQAGKNVEGWMPIVYGGIPCDPVNDDVNSSYRFVPSGGATAPATLDPNYLQRGVIIEGSVPRLGLVRP